MLRAHGIRGEVLVAPHNPATDVFRPGLTLVFEGGAAAQAHRLVLRRVRPHKRGLLLALAGIDTMTAAERLAGARVSVAEADLPPLPAGEFYWFQVVGLTAVTEEGRPLGRVAEILETPAHDVYVVREGEREILVPAVEEVVRLIDPAGGRIVVRPIEGLLAL